MIQCCRSDIYKQWWWRVWISSPSIFAWDDMVSDGKSWCSAPYNSVWDEANRDRWAVWMETVVTALHGVLACVWHAGTGRWQQCHQFSRSRPFPPLPRLSTLYISLPVVLFRSYPYFFLFFLSPHHLSIQDCRESGNWTITWHKLRTSPTPSHAIRFWNKPWTETTNWYFIEEKKTIKN